MKQNAEKAEATRRQVLERKAKEQAQKEIAEARKKAFEEVRQKCELEPALTGVTATTKAIDNRRSSKKGAGRSRVEREEGDGSETCRRAAGQRGPRSCEDGPIVHTTIAD